MKKIFLSGEIPFLMELNDVMITVDEVSREFLLILIIFAMVHWVVLMKEKKSLELKEF